MSEQFDLIVIGAGPGGYVAAIRAAQLGLKTACVESRKSLGGTCLNVGCIPSKALLVSSEKFEEAQHHLKDHGVKVSKVELDLAAMMGHKNKVVADNTAGIEFLFKKNKVTRFHGKGSLIDPHTVKVAKADGSSEEIKAKHIMIATGSDVVSLPGIEIDERQIVSSTGALELSKVPKKMLVIGGGVIGLELGSVWQRLGAEVCVVEYLDRILPGMDLEVSKQMQKILTKQGMAFELGQKVLSAKASKQGVSVEIEPAKGGAKQKLDVDIVLVAVGRKAYTEGLGLEALGISCDERGRIEVNDQWQSLKYPHIFAIGDVIKGPMLAHKAEEEGVAVAEILAGQHGHVNFDVIPGVVYTSPEVAQVGQTEEELKAKNIEYKVGKFPFSANGRARAMNQIDGFAKLLACKKTDRLLGAHIIGPDAGHLIAEICVGMEFTAAAEDIARTCHAHPTLSEVVKEAALDCDKRAIHM